MAETTDNERQLEVLYMVYLKKGPSWTPQSTPELAKLQEAHLAYLDAIYAQGKLPIHGPVWDGPDKLRGFAVYRVASLEEARQLAENDPAVKAGRLAVEVHPWAVAKGRLP